MADISYIKLSGTTYSIKDAGALHNLDSTVTSEGTNAVAGSGIYNAITAATNALAETIAEEGYQNAEQVNSAITAITTPINNTLTGHTANTDIHVTIADKAAWNAKVDEADIAGLFGNVNYDKTTQRINFYHESTGGTVLAYIDASDFVKDSFLESVTIENKVIEGVSTPCLVFVWNTQSGIEETDIPLSNIFDPDNYMTAAQTTTAINEAVSGKQDALTAGAGIDITNDVISVTGAPLTIDDNVTSESSNPVKSSGIYTFVTGETATKQDVLVSGSNIKSINNQSLLGSGNIDVQTLPTVQGTTLIFS